MKTTSRKTLSALLAIAMVFTLFAAMPIIASAGLMLTPPLAPSGLTSPTYGSETGITLSWTDNSDNEDGFFIERKDYGSDNWTELHPGGYHLIGSGTVGANVTTYTDNTVVDGQRYTYRVRAYRGTSPPQSFSAYSNEVSPIFINAPTDLTATAEPGRIILTWTDNSEYTSEFYIQRKESGGDWAGLAGIWADRTRYIDHSGEAGKTYSYRVFSRPEGNFYSYPTNEVTVTMSNLQMIELTATAGSGGITLNWICNLTPATNTVVWKQTNSSSSARIAEPPVTDNITTFLDTAVVPGNSYTYTIEFSVDDNTYESDEVTVTMTAAPTTFTVTFNSNSGSAVASQTVATGGKATKPADPTRTGYTFDGWYSNSGLTNAYDFNAVVTANITLYAKWNVAPATTPGTGSMANFIKKNTYTSGMFNDVNNSHWFESNVAIAFEYGLMQGSSATTFNPTGNMTLAEALTIAARVNDIYKGGSGEFTQGSVWYQVYVDYAIANGIIVAGDFSSYTRAATRAEMAYIFSRSIPNSEFAVQNTVNSLPDVNSDTPYSDAILTLYRAGVLTGNNEQGSFSPGNNITRAEAAAIISRIILPDTRGSGKMFG